MRNSREGLQPGETKSLRIGSILRSLFNEHARTHTIGTTISIDSAARAQMTPEDAALFEAFYLPETSEEATGKIGYEMSGKDTDQSRFAR